MEQGEQHAHRHREHKAEADIVVHELGHQQAAEQRAEEPEAHGDGQRELFQRLADSVHPIVDDAAGEDDHIGQRPRSDGRVYVGQRGRQGDGMAVDRDGLEPQQLKERTHKDERAHGEDVSA